MTSAETSDSIPPHLNPDHDAAHAEYISEMLAALADDEATDAQTRGVTSQ